MAAQITGTSDQLRIIILKKIIPSNWGLQFTLDSAITTAFFLQERTDLLLCFG
jgi:hypothetical protein